MSYRLNVGRKKKKNNKNNRQKEKKKKKLTMLNLLAEIKFKKKNMKRIFF